MKKYLIVVLFSLLFSCEIKRDESWEKAIADNRMGTIVEITYDGCEYLKFSDMFRESPNEATKYNQQDVIILPKLDNKCKHLSLQNELRKICKTNFEAAKTPMGQLDSLLVAFLKENGISSKNADVGEKGGKFEGAFVKEPIAGIHEYIVDFDFASLYPSLILTYNIGVNTFVMKFKEFAQGYDFCYDIHSLPDTA